jgi:hypothetical protein
MVACSQNFRTGQSSCPFHGGGSPLYLNLLRGVALPSPSHQGHWSITSTFGTPPLKGLYPLPSHCGQRTIGAKQRTTPDPASRRTNPISSVIPRTEGRDSRISRSLRHCGFEVALSGGRRGTPLPSALDFLSLYPHYLHLS